MKKLNVGADESRSPLTQKGITLIALIITIIVMLILVGVTINVALNGGLIEKATTASNQTQIEVLKEKAELAKANAYAESIKNETTLNANSVAVAIAEELEGTATENYVKVETTKGTYYVVVDNELKVTVTQTEPQIQPAEVDDLIPTDAEKALADIKNGNMFGFAERNVGNGDEVVMYYEAQSGTDTIRTVNIATSGKQYMWICDKASADFYSSYLERTIESNKWYNSEGNMPSTICTEKITIDFTDEQIYSKSYINRVTASFEN